MRLLAFVSRRFLSPRFYPMARIAHKGLSMFFSRLGEPARLQAAVGHRLAEPDQLAVGAVERAQPRIQPADLQRLTVAQARFARGVELGARQPVEQRGEGKQ